MIWKPIILDQQLVTVVLPIPCLQSDKYYGEILKRQRLACNQINTTVKLLAPLLLAPTSVIARAESRDLAQTSVLASPFREHSPQYQDARLLAPLLLLYIFFCKIMLRSHVSVPFADLLICACQHVPAC